MMVASVCFGTAGVVGDSTASAEAVAATGGIPHAHEATEGEEARKGVQEDGGLTTDA